MKTNQDSSYYLLRLEKYWRKFARIFRSSDKILPKYLEPSLIVGITEETKSEFKAILSELPYIGGDENVLTFTFVSSAVALAYIRAIERRDLSADAAGAILNEIYSDVFTSLPGVAKMLLRWSEFSSFRQNKLRSFAKASQLREYPENWVMEFLEGDGRELDFGCNYTECAVLKFFRKVGAEKYVPYLCATDIAYSNALCLGLQRSKTLYNGCDFCDFRYKKNGPSQPGLPLEELLEFQNRRA